MLGVSRQALVRFTGLALVGGFGGTLIGFDEEAR